MALGNIPAARSRTAMSPAATSDSTPALARVPKAPASATRLSAARGEHAPTWLRIDEAATLLGVSVITLRRAIERNARRDAERRIFADFDGVHARKIGRHWRVFLDDCWAAPAAG